MRQYLELCNKVLDQGILKENRTGMPHLGYTGDMCQYDLANGFPLLTTKKMPFKTIVAEMLGFLCAYNNAREFRDLGCKVWDANANENEQWLGNRYRNGTDDLGRIYGVQARQWHVEPGVYIDQLQKVVCDLKAGKDNRREIVSHWNPAELDKMALPPCHLLYQFGIQGNTLNLSMYQRSCDVPLGVPFNIAGYAWLLSVVAHICNLNPGVFTHFMHDIHIYQNQIGNIEMQLKREPYKLPTLIINAAIKDLTDLETWVTPDDFDLINYQHHPAIHYPFAT